MMFPVIIDIFSSNWLIYLFYFDLIELSYLLWYIGELVQK